MTSQDGQVDYISSGGLGTQISPTSYCCQRGAFGVALSTHHVPGRRVQHGVLVWWGVGVG